MECEHLFKGKRDNNEWIEGNLIYDPDLEVATILGFNYELTSEGLQRERFCKSVIPETVGRFTGKELDGKKLFVGDIIESYEDYDDKFGYPATNVFKSVVIWDEKNFCFAFDTDGYIQPFNDWDWENSRIIGNIHDNPEIIKEVCK